MPRAFSIATAEYFSSIGEDQRAAPQSGAPMRHTIGPFFHLHRLRISNVFLLRSENGNWLIDCGHALERLLLRTELRRAGIRPGELRGVLLTHRHSDHAGNAAWLSQLRDQDLCPPRRR